jgi:hypothetical protein
MHTPLATTVPTPLSWVRLDLSPDTIPLLEALEAETDPEYAVAVASAVTELLADPQRDESLIEERLDVIADALRRRGLRRSSEAVPTHVNPVSWAQRFYRELFRQGAGQ